MSTSQYPTLGQSVPIYNYLIDIIDDFLEKPWSNDIIQAANKAKEKLQQYYPTSDGLVYVIETSMYYLFNFLIVNFNNNYLNSYGSTSQDVILQRQWFWRWIYSDI